MFIQIGCLFKVGAYLKQVLILGSCLVDVGSCSKLMLLKVGASYSVAGLRLLCIGSGCLFGVKVYVRVLIWCGCGCLWSVGAYFGVDAYVWMPLTWMLIGCGCLLGVSVNWV